MALLASTCDNACAGDVPIALLLLAWFAQTKVSGDCQGSASLLAKQAVFGRAITSIPNLLHRHLR